MSLFLVDGHALAYRAYYAFIRRPLVNSRGEQTSAVYGFTKTIINILERFDPPYLGVVFDSDEKTFRHEIFPLYKANRDRMPEELVSQLPWIERILAALSVPALAQPGYEADDIIATLAGRFEGSVPVRVVSGDKDLYQIVTPRTHLIRPGKGGLLEEEVDPDVLRKKMGLEPAQFVDFLALMGDPSDNIPGVPGVGEKTALKLIGEFGSLERIYTSLDRIPSPSLRRKLIEGHDSALLSRRLVTLDRSVPVEVGREDLKRKDFQPRELDRILRELEFEGILRSLAVTIPEVIPAAPSDYRLVSSEQELAELVARLEGCREFALDVEASSLDPMRATLAGISFATEPLRAWYVPVRTLITEEQPTLAPPRYSAGLELDRVREHLGPLLADGKRGKVGQNIKYDAVVLANAGLRLRGVSFDTMLASYCLHPARKSHGLDSLAAEFLGHETTKFAELFPPKSGRRDIREVPVEKVKDYACEDADVTLRLKEKFARLLEASQVRDLFYQVEMPLCQVLTDMELWGVKVDRESLHRLARTIGRKMAELEEEIYREAGERFNINSTPKLREVLFVKLGLKPGRRTKTGYSTDVDVLKGLAREHRLPQLVLEYRGLAKLKSTYVDALPALVHPSTGRVHTSYNQAVTSTGRLSSSDPNLQNIPVRTPLGREIRRAFVAGGDGWVLLDADYSQVELRILAHLSGDSALVAAFREGADVHRRTAAAVLGVGVDDVDEEMRSRAKAVNFGIIYGMGARGLAQALGISGGEARDFIAEYFRCYPGVRRFIEETVGRARREKAVSTLLGRVRQLPDIDSDDSRLRSFAERTAVNTTVQGTAADIIKLAMVRIHRALQKRRLQAKMILQVHDELLFDLPMGEVDEVRELVRKEMEEAVELSVPLAVEVGVGKSWLEAHP